MTSWMVPTARPPPSWIECVSMAPAASRWLSAEKASSRLFWMMMERPKVTSRGKDIAAQGAVEECALQRVAEHEQDRRRHQRAEERPDAQRLGDGQHDEGREHDEVAVRQVDEAHDAEDQRQAGGEQRVEPAQHDALQQGVEHDRHVPKYALWILSRSRSAGRPLSDMRPSWKQ